MTTLKTTRTQSRFQLPDIPQREPDEMTSYEHLHKTGSSHYLALHFGNPDTTLVEAERYIVMGPGPSSSDVIRRYPDLLVAFDVDPVAYKRSNGYVISEQGKPPDFVLEVASASTADIDTGEKRDDYAALGIPEYWRFDETGEDHGVRLAGDRLVDGAYEPLPIERLSDDTLQGYSTVLGLNMRWHDGRLEWYDPATGRHIVTFDDERARADDERARADDEHARADDEHEGRIQAESRAEAAAARVRELEEELRRIRAS